MVCADTRMNRWSLGNLRFVRIVPRLLALFQTGDRPVLFTNSSKFRSSLREVPVSKSLHETRTCKFLPTWRPPLFYYFGGIVSTFGSLKVNARFHDSYWHHYHTTIFFSFSYGYRNFIPPLSKI